MNKTKKWLSIILTLCMIMSLMPTVAFAETGSVPEQQATEPTERTAACAITFTDAAWAQFDSLYHGTQLPVNSQNDLTALEPGAYTLCMKTDNILINGEGPDDYGEEAGVYTFDLTLTAGSTTAISLLNEPTPAPTSNEAWSLLSDALGGTAVVQNEYFTVDGSTITMNADITAETNDTFLTVPAGVTATLDLNGHILSRGLTAAAKSGYVLNVGGSLTVQDSSAAGTGTLTGGNNSDEYNEGGGGAVFVDENGSFTFNSGRLSGNQAIRGGAVFVSKNGSFVMNGGTISDNTTTQYGTVYLSGCSATMTGGTITENSADTGGGIYMEPVDTTDCLRLTGGSITGNEASYGGGVYYAGGMLGARSLELSGSIIIRDNTAKGSGMADNLRLYKSSSPNRNIVMKVVGAFDSTAEIGVNTSLTPTADTPVTITCDLANGGNNAISHFVSDDYLYVIKEVSNEAVLAVPDTPVLTMGMICYNGSQDYTGEELRPIYLKDGDKVLTEGTDYIATYENNVNVGIATATFTGIGNYSGTLTETFDIFPAIITGIDYSVDPCNPKVTCGNKVLTKDVDYTVVVELRRVRVEGKGNYEVPEALQGGTSISAFTGIELADCNYDVTPGKLVSIGIYEATWTGTAFTPEVSVSYAVDDDDIMFIEDTDYTVTIIDVDAGKEVTQITKPGTYQIEIMEKVSSGLPKMFYLGYDVNDAAYRLSDCKITVDPLVFDGKAYLPTVTVMDPEGNTLTEGVDYEITGWYLMGEDDSDEVIDISQAGEYFVSLQNLKDDTDWINVDFTVISESAEAYEQLQTLITTVTTNLSDGKYAGVQYTSASIDQLRTALLNAKAVTAEASVAEINAAYDALLQASTPGENGLIAADKNIVISFANDGAVRGIAEGNGWYAIGDTVTLKVAPRVGYGFEKWTTDASGTNSIGSESIYSFTLDADSLDTYYAWLNEVKYTITFENTEGGSAAADADEYVYGTSATVTATADTEYTFVGWKDIYGTTVSTDASYTFTVLDNTTLTPEFVRTQTDAGAEITYVTVNFYHQSGVLLDSQKVISADGRITSTVNDPTKNGFVFLGWSTKQGAGTQEDVLDFTTTAFTEDTNLYPVFKAEKDAYTLTVDGVTTEHTPHSTVTVTADPIQGKQFVGWKNASGEIVSYDETYTFVIAGNTELTSYYEMENAALEKKPTITMTEPIYETVDGGYKMTFYFDYTLPEDCKLVDIGTIKVKDTDLSADGITLDTANVSKTSTISKLGVDGQFYYSKLNRIGTGHTVAGYMVYEKSGIRYTVYSNAAYGTYMQ